MPAASAETTQLHLFLSIVVLMLLLRLFSAAPEAFDVALFSCVSLPATYALTYYHARAYRVGRFVREKNPEPVRLWAYEMVALLTSYMMGYVVFSALSGQNGYAVFTSAFVTVQVMRLLVTALVGHLKSVGVDVQHPVVVLLVSTSVAAAGLVGLSILFSLLQASP